MPELTINPKKDTFYFKVQKQKFMQQEVERENTCITINSITGFIKEKHFFNKLIKEKLQ